MIFRILAHTGFNYFIRPEKLTGLKLSKKITFFDKKADCPFIFQQLISFVESISTLSTIQAKKTYKWSFIYQHLTIKLPILGPPFPSWHHTDSLSLPRHIFRTIKIHPPQPSTSWIFCIEWSNPTETSYQTFFRIICFHIIPRKKRFCCKVFDWMFC